MKKIITSLFLIIITVNVILCSGVVNAANEPEAKTATVKVENKLVKNLRLKRKRDAIIGVADEYYANRGKIKFSQKKRQLNVKPEKARYLDSSAFVHNIYRQAFGVKIKTRTAEFIAEAKKECKAEYKNKIKENDEHIICYVDNVNKVKNDINNLKDILKPGDLIVWREDKNGKECGYIVMYIGDGKIIRCTNKKTAIQKDEVNKLINKDGNIYLGREAVKKFAVIRPINAKYMKNAKVTKYAEPLVKKISQREIAERRKLQNENKVEN